MFVYSKSELIRRYFILIKNSFKGIPIRIWPCISFILRYTYFTFTKDNKQAVLLNTQEYGILWIRTKSSDLEVFFQHFIYNELIHDKLKILRNIGTVLDLGANVGFATIILARIFPAAKIVAIELEKENYDILQQNCRSLIKSGRVVVVLGAFYPKKDANIKIMAGSLGDWNFFIQDGAPANESEQVNIDIYTMDDIMKLINGKNPDFIKMDIEGGEVSFLADDYWCRQVLSHSNLILELHTFKAYDLYFHQLRKNDINDAVKIGEYWMTNKKNN